MSRLLKCLQWTDFCHTCPSTEILNLGHCKQPIGVSCSVFPAICPLYVILVCIYVYIMYI